MRTAMARFELSYDFRKFYCDIFVASVTGNQDVAQGFLAKDFLQAHVRKHDLL